MGSLVKEKIVKVKIYILLIPGPILKGWSYKIGEL